MNNRFKQYPVDVVQKILLVRKVKYGDYVGVISKVIVVDENNKKWDEFYNIRICKKHLENFALVGAVFFDSNYALTWDEERLVNEFQEIVDLEEKRLQKEFIDDYYENVYVEAHKRDLD